MYLPEHFVTAPNSPFRAVVNIENIGMPDSRMPDEGIPDAGSRDAG